LDFLHNLQWVLPLRNGFTVPLAFGFSWLGYATFLMLFMSVGYWVWSKERFFRLLVIVAANALVNAYAKDLFQDPRPALELRLDDLVGASYGLPSGHAQMAVAMWMWLAWEVRRAWFWWLCGTIALGVITSRLLLGVHDVEDVLIGAALGGASLFVMQWARTQRWVQDASLSAELLAIVGITLAAVLSWPVPEAPDFLPMLCIWLATATVCLRWDNAHTRFAMPQGAVKTVIAAVLGVAVFMGVQALLKISAHALLPNAVLWSAFKGLLNGVLVALLVPWGLRQLRLTPQAPRPF
jgi:membrane-associated phospholipid phosphatase